MTAGTLNASPVIFMINMLNMQLLLSVFTLLRMGFLRMRFLKWKIVRLENSAKIENLVKYIKIFQKTM